MKDNEYQCPVCRKWFGGNGRVMIQDGPADCWHGEDREIAPQPVDN